MSQWSSSLLTRLHDIYIKKKGPLPFNISTKPNVAYKRAKSHDPTWGPDPKVWKHWSFSGGRGSAGGRGHSPLSLHLAQTHVHLDLLLRKQRFLHVRFDTPKQERPEHLELKTSTLRGPEVPTWPPLRDGMEQLEDLGYLQCEDARPTSCHPGSCWCRTRSQSPIATQQPSISIAVLTRKSYPV